MWSSVPLKPSRPELHPVLSPARSQTTGVRGCCPQKPVKPIQYAVSTARTIKPNSLKSQSRMNRQTGEISGLALCGVCRLAGAEAGFELCQRCFTDTQICGIEGPAVGRVHQQRLRFIGHQFLVARVVVQSLEIGAEQASLGFAQALTPELDAVRTVGGIGEELAVAEFVAQHSFAAHAIDL